MSYHNYVEQAILGATPVELIVRIYEHTLGAVRSARQALAQGDIAERSQGICTAISAIGELLQSLDHSHSPEMSVRLEELYHYMRRRLTDANRLQQDGPLEEVENLLLTLLEAWRSVPPVPQQPEFEALQTPALSPVGEAPAPTLFLNG